MNNNQHPLEKTRQRFVDAFIAFVLIASLLLAIFLYDGDFVGDFKRVFIRNNEYLSILKGLGVTIIIAVGGLFFGLIIGLLVCLVNFIKSNTLIVIFLKRLASLYVWVFRGTPITVQLLIIYYIVLANVNSNAVIIAIITFGLNSGAYVSEILRGGISSIPKGQHEAGLSLGLSYIQTMKKIIVPQAIKNTMPSIGNEFIALIKETSVVGFITVIDLTQAIRSTANATFILDLPYLFLGIIYLVIVLGVTIILKYIERGLNKSARD